MEIVISRFEDEECWNEGALDGYAEQVNEEEARVLSRNPDVGVIPGRIAYQGCVLNEGDNGIYCTVQLTKTQYAVAGESTLRPENAYASAMQIPGFKLVKPRSGRMADGYVPSDGVPVVAAVAQSPARRCLRRFIGR
jgi:hypothetical protein